jgi:hypothetical protein
MIELQSPSARRFLSRLGYSLLSICFLSFVGCTEEPIQHYKAPKVKENETGKKETETAQKETEPVKTNTTAKTPASEPQKSGTRLLGLAIPDGNSTWYVKLMGPSEVINDQSKAFDQFVASIKFPKEGDKPMTWTVPEGWRKGKGNQFSYAAFAVGPESGPSVELTISQVGGSVLDNLNRWRGQLGLNPIQQSEIAQTFSEIQIDGKKALKVDMSGTGGKGMVPPFMKGR